MIVSGMDRVCLALDSQEVSTILHFMCGPCQQGSIGDVRIITCRITGTSHGCVFFVFLPVLPTFPVFSVKISHKSIECCGVGGPEIATAEYGMAKRSKTDVMSSGWFIAIGLLARGVD